MSTPQPTPPARAWQPDPSTVVREATWRPPSPEAGALEEPPSKTYEVLRTTQRDAYDEIPETAVLEAAGALETAGLEQTRGRHFKGVARRVAKISVSPAETEEFAHLRELIATLPPDDEMAHHDPRIGDDADSDRVAREHRNVRLPVFLYAASREKDNDFHLIVGTDPDEPPLMCMNVELSGLPPESSDHFGPLRVAREAFMALMATIPLGPPGFDYDVYPTPLPLLIAGSLFFDINHATGIHPGPEDLRPFIPTVWEIHPITEFVPRL